MGIDVYLRWDGQTQEEKQAQYTGFSTWHGHVGYLRESYHGGPYATKVLIPEGWVDEKAESVVVESSVLESRLPDVLDASRKRSLDIYQEKLDNDDPVLRSFIDFVALHKRLESEGKNPKIIISA